MYIDVEKVSKRIQIQSENDFFYKKEIFLSGFSSIRHKTLHPSLGATNNIYYNLQDRVETFQQHPLFSHILNMLNII